LSSNSQANEITETILKVIHEKKPQSMKQLMTILKESLDLEEKEIVESVLKLQAEGIIKLENEAVKSQSLATYMKTREANWYWVTIAAGAISAALVFTISKSIYPWAYVRNVFWIIFILFLPGYAFIKALFPTKKLAKTTMENLNTTEQVALSIVMSLATVTIVGLLLNYSPWGLDLNAIVLSLLAFTSFFATIAVIRKHQLAIKTGVL
jgi:uncharacterized membrane protein